MRASRTIRVTWSGLLVGTAAACAVALMIVLSLCLAVLAVHGVAVEVRRG